MNAQRAPASQGRRAPTSIPVDVGRLREDINPAMLGRRRKRRSPVALIAAVVVAVLAVGVASTMGGLKLFAQHGAPSHPKAHVATATATALPTATATVAQPTTTATPTAQQKLNQQASSAFRGITLASYTDGSCASSGMTTSFSPSSPVYVNLCMAYSPAPGPVTVTVRQHGATVRTFMSNLYPAAGASYSQGHTLNPGSYDLLVTMQINGKQAVARDIAFTVQ